MTAVLLLGVAGVLALILRTELVQSKMQFLTPDTYNHIMGLHGIVMIASILVAVVLAVPAALVGWSRVCLKRHTWFQVITGWSTAAACVIAVFQFLP